MLSEEATNTNFIVFDLIRTGLNPTIYHIRGEHANHYATNEIVMDSLNILICVLNIIDRKVQRVNVNNS